METKREGGIKLRRFIAVLCACVCLSATVAFAFEPVTLKDDSTGNTAELYPIPDEEELLLYHNPRFGYSVSVPHKFFTQVVLLPDNGDGWWEVS